MGIVAVPPTQHSGLARHPAGLQARVSSGGLRGAEARQTARHQGAISRAPRRLRLRQPRTRGRACRHVRPIWRLAGAVPLIGATPAPSLTAQKQADGGERALPLVASRQRVPGRRLRQPDGSVDVAGPQRPGADVIADGALSNHHNARRSTHLRCSITGGGRQGPVGTVSPRSAQPPARRRLQPSRPRCWAAAT